MTDISRQIDLGGNDLICNNVFVSATGPGQAGSSLNVTDLVGVTPGTAAASKALVLDSSKGIATITTATITTLTSTTANVTTLAATTAGATTVNAGASGTAGTVNSFPTTASKGKLTLAAADSTGNTTSTITNAAQTTTATWTIPDTNGNANFVMTAGTQTIGGAKTFSAAGVFSSTLGITGATTPTGGIAPAANSFNNGLVHTGNAPALTTTQGTDTTPSVTETYYASVQVPVNATIVGVSILNGSAAAGNVTVQLCDQAGAPIAAAKSASTAQSGTAAYQQIPFATPYAAVGPQTYVVAVQFNNTSARFRSHILGNFYSGKKTGETYGTVTTLTLSAFTTNLGPIASLY